MLAMLAPVPGARPAPAPARRPVLRSSALALGVGVVGRSLRSARRAEFLDFVGRTGSPAHTVQQAKERLVAAGFQEVQNDWPKLEPGAKYFITKARFERKCSSKGCGKGDHRASKQWKSPLRGFGTT